MACYVVAYDLNKKGQNYKCLCPKLKNYDHLKLSESCYLISTTKTAEEIINPLLKCTDDNDTLTVLEVKGDWQALAFADNHDWLFEHLN